MARGEADPGTTPPGEDGTHGQSAARVVSFYGEGTPPGEDHVTGDGPSRDIDTTTADSSAEDFVPLEKEDEAPDWNPLQLVTEAEQQSLFYSNQANRQAWSDALKAFHNEHASGSKYNRSDWRNRTKNFVPKTRSAIRKDMAAVAASLFNSMDAISCSPGNEADPKQRAAASVIQELVNYRTNRTSGRDAIAWMAVSMGARLDALLAGVCVSKQHWKLDLKLEVDRDPQTGAVKRDPQTGKPMKVYRPCVDRPDIHLFPSENFIVDSAADWTNPAQNSAYFILKYPMRVDDIVKKQKSPIKPWLPVSEEILRTAVESTAYDASAIRRAREMGLDRLDETQTGYRFKVVWVYENFIKVNGEDWHWWSVGSKALLTNPALVEDVYPEQFGDRPIAMGYGSLESHRIFPMAPAESWRMLQSEINDIRNLSLDATKQNVMPITKIRRGRQVDLDQVKRRSSGSAILVSDPTDVTWEVPPQLGAAVPQMMRDLELEFDDLAGQFNGGTTENNNALSRTLGGLKLVAGAANAVQEFDIRIWITTWCEPVLAQLVRLEQWFESDPVVLGLCGERAQLFQKYGINKIDDELLEQQVSVSVSVGLGAGDPQARLAKFSAATQICGPLLAQSPEFQSGAMEIDPIAVLNEVYGAAGYRDGGMRFIKKGQPKPNPLGNLPAQKIQSEIERNLAQAKAAKMTGLAALAKVELGDRQLEADNANALMDRIMSAHDMGHQHAHALHDRLLAATDHGHRHGLAITQHRQNVASQAADRATAADNTQWDRQQAAQQASAPDAASGGGDDQQPDQGAAPDQGAPAPAAAPQQPGPADDTTQTLADLEQKIDRLTQMVTVLAQQQHRPMGGFPANPYPNQGA